MPLSKEQTEQIKKQLLKQIESWPEEQRSSAKEKIEEMTEEEFEEFLIQNKIIQKEGEESKKEEKQECVFCSIIQNKIPSYKLDENKTSLAILEINPLSKGHSIVISKTHTKLPSSAFSLANKLGKRIKSRLKAEEVKIENASIFGHHLINIIPLYKEGKLEKRKAEEKELILLQDKLKAKPRKKKEKKIQVTEIKLEQAPRRIP